MACCCILYSCSFLPKVCTHTTQDNRETALKTSVCNPSGSAIQKALFCLVLPCAEWFALRFIVRNVIGFRPGFPAFTDYDFVFPFGLSMVVLLWLWQQSRELSLRFRKQGLLLNLFALVIFLFSSWYLRDIPKPQDPLWFYAWFAFGIFVIASSLLIFLDPQYVWNHPRWKLIFPALLIGSSKLIAGSFLEVIWPPLATATGATACGILQSLIPGISCAAGTYYRITHPSYGVSIGVGCSGVDGLSLFVFCFGLLEMGISPGRSWSLTLLWAALGCIGVWMTNVARIVLFYPLVLVSIDQLGQEYGIKVAFPLLHNSMGWVLNVLFLLLYFRLLYVPQREVRRSAATAVRAPNLQFGCEKIIFRRERFR